MPYTFATLRKFEKRFNKHFPPEQAEKEEVGDGKVD